jgi:hypothetical protein
MRDSLKTRLFSKPFLICLALSFLTALAYWSVRHHEFINFDDGRYVSENYVVQQGLTGKGYDGLSQALMSGTGIR